MYLLRLLFLAGAFSCVMSTAYAGFSLNNIVAVVNDEPITEFDLEQHLNQLKEQNRALPPMEILKEQLLTYLIGQKVQLQRANQLGIFVSPAQISLAMQEIARENQMTVDEFTAHLSDANISIERFKQQIEQELILSRLYQKDVTSKINVTEKEVDLFLASPEGQRHSGIEYHLRHALFSLPTNPSPEAIEKANRSVETFLAALSAGQPFQALAQQFSDAQDALEGGDLGWRKSAEIPSIFAKALPALEPGGVSAVLRNSSGYHLVYLEGIRQNDAHQNDERHFRHLLIKDDALYPESAILQQLNHYRAEVLNQEKSFAELAKQYSEDIATAYLGGDMGWVRPSDVPEDFHALFNDLKPGEVSAPIKTAFGWHLVQRADDAHNAGLNQEQLRAQAKRFLQRQKFDEKLEDYQQKLLAEAYIVRSNDK